MENIKTRSSHIVIFTALFVGIFAYLFGEATGRDKTKEHFLDSAYISYCDDDGTYCYLETNYGQKGISCDEKSNCITQEKVPGERDKEIEGWINKITDEEVNKILEE